MLSALAQILVNRQAGVLQRALGARIQNLRDFRGWSQEDLAIRSGLNRTDMSGIERGDRDPTLGDLEAIAGCLGVTISEMLSGFERL